MLNLTSPILSDGLTTRSISCPNYSLRGFVNPSSKPRPLTAKPHQEIKTPHLSAVAANATEPLLFSSRAHERDQKDRRDQKDKLVVIMGATGSGKSRLSVDLANIFSGEIVNSDKLQFYNGLEITTNQMTVQERQGVPHHLLGEVEPEDGELTAAEFRSAAARAISGIVSRGNLPILAGGSNSFVHALLAERWDPETYPFNGRGSICSDLRYDCCFIWIDVAPPLLFEYHSRRVDKMLERGMFEELAELYDPKNDPGESWTRIGLWKSIGVPEFDRYFRKYPPQKTREAANRDDWDAARKSAYDRAVREVKENTFLLAMKQIEKIQKLRSAGWDIRRVDAAAWFRSALSSPDGDGGSGGRRCKEIWEREILEPCVERVRDEVFCLGEKQMTATYY
ncbi:PREDICTED: adenylate isopentenyltransferase 4-like [Tarenaya hassleriana]|uniref:adenylate isopentenyltransferase 4-like n=1 Tax=Tarenaya hassleriana TaxID=28532 RepID=UPI00053C761B|nr:PREDICTED: adenylate isopentenyltransferase 4-like [Tarenaya hassleriana]